MRSRQIGKRHARQHGADVRNAIHTSCNGAASSL
jgi:hypothetical protein